MTSPLHRHWPLFRLRVVTPRIELRYIDDELGAELAELALRGIHDPASMPFAVPWTDAPVEEMPRNTLQFYWRCRVETSADSWHLPLAVLADGVVIGTTSLVGEHFPVLRQFETGSWLGRAHQRRGFGKELRRASLHLGFEGLGGELARTSAFVDNEPSLGVTRSLGYREVGYERKVQREVAGTTIRFEMTADDWRARVRTDDISIDGLDGARALLGLT